MSEVLKVGLYILLFVPGFIFVQTRDYHLLRAGKPQLEKTLEIVLLSAFIWMLACLLPMWWPCDSSRKEAIREIGAALGSGAAPVWASALSRACCLFFITVCGWAYFLANVWGWLRKQALVDTLFIFLTGRDWYPSESFRFFGRNLNRVVAVKVDGGTYLGMLSGAPDCESDNHIILTNVAFLADGAGQKPEILAGVDSLLIRFDDLNELRALTVPVKRSVGLGNQIRDWFVKTWIFRSVVTIIQFGDRKLREAQK